MAAIRGTAATTPLPRERYHHGALREALVQAAEDLIEEVGPERMTLREAARRAGVSHAAPAHHFGDLGGLLTEVAAAGFERLAEALAKAGEDAGPGFAALSRTGHAYVTFALAHPGLFQLMFRSRTLAPDSARLNEAMDRAFAAFAARVPEQPPAGPDDAVLRAASLVRNWSMVHGFAFLAIDGRLDGVARDFGIEIAGLLEATLAPPPDAAC